MRDLTFAHDFHWARYRAFRCATRAGFIVPACLVEHAERFRHSLAPLNLMRDTIAFTAKMGGEVRLLEWSGSLRMDETNALLIWSKHR